MDVEIDSKVTISKHKWSNTNTNTSKELKKREWGQITDLLPSSDDKEVRIWVNTKPNPVW